MNVFLKQSEFYMCHSNNKEDRFKASSGGIGTAIVKYLLQKDYGTSMTFVFDKEKCMYVPKMIHSHSEVNICGSIYQDIDIYGFIKANINEIRNGMVVSCPPCQVSVIQQFLDKHKIKSFIISFSCSGQTTIEGTWCYYRFIGLDKKDIANMQYRGNGWPSGIQIQTTNGDKIFKHNYTEPWASIHQSLLFRPIKCLYCKRDTSWKADVSLADPWLEAYKKLDNIGHTLVIVNSLSGKKLINDLSENGKVTLEPSNYNEYAVAQYPNVKKTYNFSNRKKHFDFIRLLISNHIYHKWATKSLSNMHIHTKLIRMSSMLFKKHYFPLIIEKFINRLVNHFRSKLYGSMLEKAGRRFFVTGKIELNNPHCISVGNNVGIGKGTYLGPVTEYAGIPYNPRILIGDDTWVGKNCSIAAINKVEIGKHVLFAGHVHITDHSHGYEDTSQPITPQKLLCKGPVIIEDDCWLGFSCEILSGVHIGKHCIVAARSVVTKDVPPYSIVAGNPARIVKRYNPETDKWEKVKK